MKKILVLLFFIPSLSFGLRFTSSQIVTSGDMSTTEVDSIPVDMNQILNASIQAVYTGSPVGTLKLQFSDSLTLPCNSSSIVWNDYTGSSQSITVAGRFAYNLLDAGYRCLRLVYVRTSGTGTLNATFSGKGP